MKNIKAIIFDAYGTLFDVNSAAEKCKDKIGDKWEGFANYWRTTQLEYTWLRSLMNRHKDFWQVTEDSLDKSMMVFKIDPSMKNELLDLYKILSTFPEVIEVLKNLKERNYKLAILKYRNALEILTPNSSTPFFNLAECALILNDLTLADQWIRKGVSIGGAPKSYLKSYKGFLEIQEKEFYKNIVSDYNFCTI